MIPHVEVGDGLLLVDGTKCTCSQSWHGKDEAWLEVQYQRDGMTVTRSIESFDIAEVYPA